MRILRNKYFILGNLLLLLITIPVTIFFIKKQTEVRTKAQASTRLFFNPATITKSNTCPNLAVDVMADPGQNLVATVNFFVTFDATKLELISITPSSSFSSVHREASIGSGTGDISVSTGGDTTKSITTVTKVATLTFNIKQGAEGATQIKFDDTKTQVFSLNEPADQPFENVLSSTAPADITLNSGVCSDATTGTPTPTPTGGTQTSITPTLTVSPTLAQTSVTPTLTVSPTLATNLPPVCSSLSASPATSGSAPLAISFTAKGNDPDGTITKATFNFGDGQVQDVTDGMSLQNVTAQTNHTFQTGGTFGTTVTFTDNRGTISQSCSQTIIASGAGATSTPTVVASSSPTIAPTGSISTTLGIVGAVILTIIGGFLLLAL